MKTNAKVISVNISEKKGEIKKSVAQVELKEEFGIIGDAHAGKWHRQVSLLANESIEKMRAMDKGQFFCGSFAENITTSGIELFTLEIGTKLLIGDTIQEITQIGKECHNGCAIKNTIGQCIMPKEGIFTRVIKGGFIKVGDNIEIIKVWKYNV